MSTSNKKIAESLKQQEPDVYALLEEVAGLRKTSVEEVIGKVIEVEAFLLGPTRGSGRGSAF